MVCGLARGYKRNVFLIVEKVCDGNRTVADPRTQQHEEAHPRLHFTALWKTTNRNRNIINEINYLKCLCDIQDPLKHLELIQ